MIINAIARVGKLALETAVLALAGAALGYTVLRVLVAGE